ncbi:MAG TPA: ribosomal-processing cysteine protease Prp [Treponemataceae bacterium]|nr:ribosomal-processing cysteine protease Prp [Treponemataceae bacterium]
MISVDVSLGDRGNLVSASATGHAGKGKRGEDIVCAAVTVLLRTTLAVLSSNGVESSADTAGRGSLAFRVTALREGDIPFLRYAADFLLEGLGSLAREYPDAVELRVQRAIC